MRTNIEIDDDMMKQAFSVSNFRTKREVVSQALIEFVRSRTRKDLSDLRKKIEFADNYDYKVARGGKE
jgi:Arc/MetJ family transcription regulator